MDVTTDSRTAGLPQLVVLLAATCLTILGAVLISPVLPQMAEHFADTPGAEVLVIVALTVPALMIGLTAPFAGLVADRIDRRRLMVIALAVYAIAGTAPLYLDSLSAVIGSRLVLGLCEAAIMTCSTTLIGDYWSGRRRARYLGLQSVVASIGATVFVAVGGALGATGWRTPFWLYLGAAVLVIPTVLLIWQPHGRAAREDVRPSLEPIPWRLLATPLTVTLLGGMIFASLLVQLPFVLTGIGVTASVLIGAVAGLMTLCTAIGSVAFGWLLAHRRPRVLIPLELGLASVGLAVVATADSLLPVAVGAVLFGFGSGALIPTMLTWTVNRLRFEQRGRGTGLWTGGLFIGQFISPLALAVIGAGLGGLRPALGVAGAAALVAAVVIAVAVRRGNEPLDVTNS